MNEPRQYPFADIRAAFGMLGRAIPESDKEVSDFLRDFDADEIDAPPIPDQLTASVIVDAMRAGKTPQQQTTTIVPFTSGLEKLQRAARNGEGGLSDETLEKMMRAEEGLL